MTGHAIQRGLVAFAVAFALLTFVATLFGCTTTRHADGWSDAEIAAINEALGPRGVTVKP